MPWFVVSSPPTRECSVDDGPVPVGDGVLPADAGVFRRRRAYRSRPGRPPRRRGGVLRPGGPASSASPSSPPTRGCSAGRDRQPAGSRVLPADAGVFRWSSRASSPRTRPSRRRGGVPVQIHPLFAAYESSPPTRGCSAVQAWLDAHPSVLPAEAGVFPPAQTGAVLELTSSPPTRGGLPMWPASLGPVSGPPRRRRAPIVDAMRTRFPTSSLPTRWPRSDRTVPVTLSLFADAKVLRLAGFSPRYRSPSSPPMRWCSVVNLVDEEVVDVVYADAMVSRLNKVWSIACLGPPRRRGGVPIRPEVRITGKLSSSPTRGCSGVTPRDGHVRGVLPADAGVFRCPRCRPRAGPCPPRRRGGVPVTWL